MRFDIPWISGSIFHGKGLHFTMDRGSKYHGKEVQYTLGRVIDIPWVGNSKPRVGVKIPLIEGLICHG
jgi:hypothetical protein